MQPVVFFRILVRVVLLVVAMRGAQGRAAEERTNAAPSALELSLKKLQLAPGLKIELWAAEPLVLNPVAISVDERGRVFVAETHRWGSSIFDITKELPWLLNDLSFRTVAQREEFLARQFVTNSARLTNRSELIRLVEDRAGAGRADMSSVFADGFNSAVSGVAAGILARQDEVWFTCIPDLWKITRDNSAKPKTNAAPRATSGPKVHNSSLIIHNLLSRLGVHIGVSGHDAHGVILGPDGRIYFSVGDRGFAPPENIRGLGFTTKFLRRVLPDTGAVFRCNPDGSQFEVFCLGLRNPQELAFDALGNLFTVDNDTAGPDEPRVLHLVAGGDYGWRCSYQHMKNFGPWCEENVWRGGIDDVLPWCGKVAQGPCGLAFYPGTGLPDSYQGKFLVCDVPGGVWSFSLQPRGASFAVEKPEKFLWNCWPTDVAFGPDGALYVSDWVGGWGQPDKGRIYRITAKDEGDRRKGETSATLEEIRALMAEFGERNTRGAEARKGMVERKIKVEEFQQMTRETFAFLRETVSRLTSLLQHPDLRVREAAQNSISEFDLPLWRMTRGTLWLVEMDYTQPLSSPFGEFHRAKVLLSEIGQYNPQNFGDVTGGILRAMEQAKKKLPPALASQFNSIRIAALPLAADFDLEPEIIQCLKDKDAAVAFHSAMVIGSLRNRQNVLPHLIERLTSNNDADPYLTHALVVALATIGDTNTIHRAAQDTSPAVRRAASLAMRRLEMPEIARFLNDSEPRLRYEAARAINDVPIESALPELALFLGKADCTTNIMSRAINACFRLGTERHAKMLASFANRLDVPDEFRARAIEMLGHWRVEEVEPGRIPTVLERDARHGATPVVNPENWPGWFDGVVGLWRPLPRRNEQAGKRALLSVGAGVLAEGRAERAQLAVIRAAVRLQAVEAAHGLFEHLRAKNVSAAVRREIPAALAALRYAQTGEAVKLALADPDSTVRQAGIALLDQVGAGDTAGVLDALLATESNVALAQTVFATLGRLPGAAADDVLARWLGKLLAGEVRAELRLDLLEAAKQRTAPAVVAALQKFHAALPANDPLAPWRDALFGGDAARGREVFNQHAGAQCLRCHALNGKGGTVGPDLAGVGARLTRELLLESILFPNQTIAAGFENVVVGLKGGGSRAGVVKSETATELVLHSLEDGVVRVLKNTIQSRVAGLSAMPEGLAQLLTRRELRDVVEFLAALK